MKWGKVVKPKRTTPVRADGKGGNQVFDLEAYRSKYPGFGKNEHEIDSYFIGLYGLHFYIEEFKKEILEQDAQAEEIIKEEEEKDQTDELENEDSPLVTAVEDENNQNED